MGGLMVSGSMGGVDGWCWMDGLMVGGLMVGRS